MNYPITVLMNKTVEDVSEYIFKTATERNIPMDLMLFVIDSVRSKVQNEAIYTLSSMNIESLNQLDKVISEKKPEPTE